MQSKSQSGLVLLSLLAAVVYMSPAVFADTIANDRVAVASSGTTVIYNFDEVKMEIEDGKSKVCLCRCLSFRALQILASQFPNGVIPNDDIRIYTGWTTDGAEELFVDLMGWNHGDLSFLENSTDPVHLTTQDAVFFFVQRSSGNVWKVKTNEGLYPKEFFTYRTLIKTGQATDSQVIFFQTALRPQAVLNMTTLPLIDKFHVQLVPYYGEGGVLRLPWVFLAGGTEYEA